MTVYQLYTRIIHALSAAHWRGYAVHSPMMYAFVREVVIRTPRSKLVASIQARYGSSHVALYGSVAEICTTSGIDVGLLRHPYRSAAERLAFREWYNNNSAVVVHLQDLIVIFFDPKLNKQFYKIRN